MLMERQSAVCAGSAQDNRCDNAPSTELTVDPGALLRDAIDHSSHEHKHVAADLNYMGDYWSRVLSNERGVMLDRLGKLPLDVQRAWLTAWGKQIGMACGIDDDVHALVELLTTRRVRISMESVGR